MPHTENVAAPGIIFDLDGTLADTLQDIAEGVNCALQGHGLALQPIDRIRGWVGDGVVQLMARASGREDAGEIEGLVEVFRRRYREVCLARTRLYAGMEAALDALAAAGCPMCVLSNKPHDFTVHICRALLTRWRFMSYVGPSATVVKKPDPGAALGLARLMERQPKRVIVIGDGEADIETAKAAGMGSIAVTWGFRSEEVLRGYRPDALVAAPAELVPAVMGLVGGFGR